MRAFIAVELPQKLKDSLAEVQNKLKSCQADIKWVEPKNIHLTLKFLGEVDEKKLPEILQILKEITKDKKPIKIRLSNLGVFPKINFPRVIWMGINEEEELKTIAEELDEKISLLGFPREDRPFSSHITIGRLRSGLNREKLVAGIIPLTEKSSSESEEFFLERITLFKSTLTPHGPIYEALNSASLKTT